MEISISENSDFIKEVRIVAGNIEYIYRINASKNRSDVTQLQALELLFFYSTDKQTEEKVTRTGQKR